MFDLADADSGMVGGDAYDAFGTSVASAGDVNGDGVGDLVVGAPGAGSYYSEGVVNVSLGPSGNPWLAVNATLVGEAAGDRAGFSVAAAGDVRVMTERAAVCLGPVT